MTTATENLIKEVQGRKVPALGFGTWQLEGDDCRNAVEAALDIGYRHVDTASAYENEEAVGDALKNGSVDRGDIFLTSKVFRGDLAPDAIRRSVDQSLKKLKTDYLDLILIHWPNPEFSLEDSVAALVECKEQEKVLEIGVSNFPPSWLERAQKAGSIFCNQVEYHPLLGQEKLLRHALADDLMLTAYSPLGHGEVLDSTLLRKIGEKYGKSAIQVALRWLIDQPQVFAIPRSEDRGHIEANFDIFDFALEPEDVRRINDLPKDQRQIDPDFAPDWEDD